MAERNRPRSHVCKQASEAPHVRGLGFGARSEGDGLGSHVGRRAHGPLGLPSILVLGECGAEVGHLGVPCLREQHVARLQVAMDHVLRM